jgi:hypothetical protein
LIKQTHLEMMRSKEDVMKFIVRFSLVVFTVLSLTSSAFAERHRAAAKPVPTVNFQAAIDVVLHADGTCRSGWHIFSPGLSTGDTVELQIIRPNGTFDPASHIFELGVQADGSPFVDTPLWQGWILTGPGNGFIIPSSWGSGTAVLSAIVTTKGHQYRVSADVPVGVASTTFGSLNAIPDANGGVLITGVFMTPPVIFFPTYLNVAIAAQPVYGGWYIPPGQEGKGKTPIVVSSGIAGNPYDLKSQMIVVDIQ